MSSEPATTRVTLPKINLIWQNSCYVMAIFGSFRFLRSERGVIASLASWAQAICSFTFPPMKFFVVGARCLSAETPEWTGRDSNHHRQSVSAGKTNAIPTEPSGRLIFPYEIRAPGLPLRWQQGSFSLACEASCAPLMSAPSLGGTRHSDHHDFFARGQSMVTIQPMEGLLGKLIWEDAERGIIRCPGLCTFFLVGARCLSTDRTWDSRVDQQGFEPPPAVCQRWQDQRHANWAIGSPVPGLYSFGASTL